MELTLFRPKLLLTNDDGYGAPGLKALVRALSQVADVYVLAPDSNRSAVSSHICMNLPLALTDISPRAVTSSGNPVDCVVTGLHSNVFTEADGKTPVAFDAVFSGINMGPNMGTDTIYSGTVAAARQAVLYGVPGIALSLSSRDGSWNYDGLAAFAAKNVDRLIALSAGNVLVNVNALSASSYEKVVYSSLCIRDYHDTVQIERLPDGRRYSFFVGGSVGSHGEDDCDFAAVEQGCIALSLLAAENRAEAKPENFAFTL